MTLRNTHTSKHLSAYLHGELDKPHDSEVRAHLAKCQRCHDEFVVIRDGIRLASQLQSVVAPDRILEEIEKRLLESRRRPQRSERRFWWNRLPALQLRLSHVAAIAALVTILAAVLMYLLRPGEKSKFVWDMGPFLEMAEN